MAERSTSTPSSESSSLAASTSTTGSDPVSGFRGSSKSRACRKGTGERSGADHGGMPVTGGYTTVGGAIGKAETRVRDLEDLPLLDVGIVTRHVE